MIFFSIRRKERENSPIYPIFTRLALEYIASVIMLTINDHVKIQLFIGYAGCTRRKWCVSKRRDSWIPWLGESQQKCTREYAREYAYSLFSSVTQRSSLGKYGSSKSSICKPSYGLCASSPWYYAITRRVFFARKIDQLRHVNGSMDGSFAVGKVKRKRPGKCYLAGNWNGE